MHTYAQILIGSSFRRLLFALILLLFCMASLAQTEEESCSLRVISYNVENLFDCQHDSLKQDSDFLPDGNYHWTLPRYRTKLHHIAKVIASLSAPSSFPSPSPAIVGLLEVENRQCLSDLCRYYMPRANFPYSIVHYEGPDMRGVDVALLYDSTRLSLLSSEPINVNLGLGERPTRDILYASFLLPETDSLAADTLHLFLCHFPSQLGGSTATQHKRNAAYATLRLQTNAILLRDSNALILAMGDFNSAPLNSLPPLRNLMLSASSSLSPHSNIWGTHKFQGNWSFLDQFFVSPALLKRIDLTHLKSCSSHPTRQTPFVFAPDWLLESDNRHLGVQPFRTYSGPRYLGGYSDHLPIYLDILPYSNKCIFSNDQ